MASFFHSKVDKVLTDLDKNYKENKVLTDLDRFFLVDMSGPDEEYKVDTPDDNDCAHNDRVTEECQEESSVTKWIYRVGQHKETSSKRSQMVTLAL